MELGFTIRVSVVFYLGKRNRPPVLIDKKYYPHFVVKGDTEYLGVNFIDGPDPVPFNKKVLASVSTIYDGVNYDKLTKGTAFFIMEGGRVVGEGEVEEIFVYKKNKE